jgi:hypothetical protein
MLAGCGVLLPTSFQPSKGGDMACPESVLNHQSPLQPQSQIEAERAGILLNEHVRPGQLSLLLRSPAMVADPVRSRSLGHLLLLPGWRLGLLTEGKTASTNRAETWTSYRGERCESKQGRSLKFIQEGRLQEQSGKTLGYQTGYRAARNTRDRTEITKRVAPARVDRLWAWEKCDCCESGVRGQGTQ